MKHKTFFRRTDLQTALIIDSAITELKNSGLPQAYARLVAHGISGRIVKRLLSMPGARRKYCKISFLPGGYWP
jgi:hypothetical protein